VFPPQIKDANVIIDLAVHDIDVVNYLLGRQPTKISANSGKAMTNNRNDYADIFMEYGKTSVFIQVNWITPVKIRKINITGTKGYAEMDYINQELTVFESNYNKSVDNFGEFVIKFGTPNKVEIGVDKEEPLKRELISFINAVKEGKEPFVTSQQALIALKIALDADKCCK
jgi:UDP-N-acetylglucosamine 3-dehydrogenase